MENPEDKAIEITTNYENQSINLRFSDNLTEDRERGYILSAAFFSFCASQGLSKSEVNDMVSTYYNEFLDNEL
ncbi:hypothetical protein GA0061073_1149 [Lactobacillus apis]|uniref:hypothetical protein n=1 Tax=Lactobacillus apis TaxID=303541 RepID=UPI000815819D|nr:hypothetical protein [Lactobacillus apis]AWM73163.1 hypothetical protein DKL56_00870 [Lactobacillus apis]MCT6891429.1 hypothetical protein [Lactobacillus sp.]GGG40318.1 hypothetical protein GCM10007323_13100 [Lactobacillus apis]SCB96521.1 hypothetical protein GA0061073_1149 [Lactobacillus apis]